MVDTALRIDCAPSNAGLQGLLWHAKQHLLTDLKATYIAIEQFHVRHTLIIMDNVLKAFQQLLCGILGQQVPIHPTRHTRHKICLLHILEAIGVRDAPSSCPFWPRASPVKEGSAWPGSMHAPDSKDVRSDSLLLPVSPRAPVVVLKLPRLAIAVNKSLEPIVRVFYYRLFECIGIR